MLNWKVSFLPYFEKKRILLFTLLHRLEGEMDRLER